MAETTIPVDLRNPGQVFACLGLMEAAEILFGPATGAFTAQGAETRTGFRLAAPGDGDPVAGIVRFLTGARVRVILPPGSALDLAKWNLDAIGWPDLPQSLRDTADVHPDAGPPELDTLPGVLMDQAGRALPLWHWTDGSSRDRVKFWAGAGGMPGAAIAARTLALLADAGADPAILADAARDPFAFSRPQAASFRFDWRRDYTALDLGFSPNKHSSAITMAGYPLVELLGALGLQHARPRMLDRLRYRYGVCTAALPTLLARIALGGQAPGFPIRLFTMRLGWPGQEGQARCIIDAHEEFPS